MAVSNESSDTRFIDYVDALKAGDLDTCDRMRNEYADDEEILTRFGTVERIWLCEMSRYIREVQIVRRECTAWRTLAEGYKKLAEGDKTPPNGGACIRRGEKLMLQAAEAREEHEEVEIPKGFSGV